MRILGINGSPRIGGNTDILLDRVLEGARANNADTDKIILNNLKFSPCQECESVNNEGECVIKDDMHDLYKKIKDADVIALASPIFFGSLSAQTKIMVDRFQCLWRLKYILNKDTGYKRKKGVFVSVEGSDREDFFDNARSIVKNLFATINAEYTEELFCSKVDEKASILKHAGCLKKAFELGARLTRG
ncbi:MAG: flavodoxin family protein [Candidatus Omnitrophica bacterium]|nr:flavodoxin family protein [Candidatus Omnitrophota bacterium]MBU1932403.1 flavodoxin family protein [Candidatus Omnitrophota bacterium]